MSKLLDLINPYKSSLWLVIKDIENYIAWIKCIDKEKANPKSLWYKFNMKHNYFYTIYFPVALLEEDKALPDSIKRLKIVELLAPVHRYIDEDLQFAEYIVPEFNQFYDEDNKPTLIYGIVYRFAFKRLGFRWLISRSIFLTILLYIIIKYPVFQWITLLFHKLF